MMRPRPVALALLGLLTLAFGSCVSLKRTPGARFFVLRSLAPAATDAGRIAESATGTPAVAGELPLPEAVVGVLPARLPGALDRPQLVVATGPSELRLDELSRWAEPLDEGVTRTLAENLATLLPRHRVVRSPWASALEPRCRLATELRLFGLQPGGDVRLEATYSLLAPKDERVLARRSFTASRGPLPGGRRGVEPAVSVDAMSELLAELAGQVAATVQELPSAVP